MKFELFRNVMPPRYYPAVALKSSGYSLFSLAFINGYLSAS